MDQDRRDAAAWAQEWNIKHRNRRIIFVLAAIALIAAVAWAVNFAIVHIERTTFGSAEEMRAAMQGRYAIERDYEDIYIDGDDITLTYLAYSHYNRDFAERYGYDFNEHDSVYQDRVTEWDYRNGIIKTAWMGDIIVDKDGNIRRGDSSYGTFYKTDKPRPDPIDPSSLGSGESDSTGLAADALEAIEERTEDLESTEEAANEASEEGAD